MAGPESVTSDTQGPGRRHGEIGTSCPTPREGSGSRAQENETAPFPLSPGLSPGSAGALTVGRSQLTERPRFISTHPFSRTFGPCFPLACASDTILYTLLFISFYYFLGMDSLKRSCQVRRPVANSSHGDLRELGLPVKSQGTETRGRTQQPSLDLCRDVTLPGVPCHLSLAQGAGSPGWRVSRRSLCGCKGQSSGERDVVGTAWTQTRVPAVLQRASPDLPLWASASL